MKYLMFALTLLCGPSMAQNLVNNGSFDENIDGWESYKEINWISDDGHADDGAFEIKSNDNNGGVANATYLPIEVNEERSYKLTVSMKVMPNTQATDAVAIITWLNENQWSVGYNEFLFSDPDVTDGTWHRQSFEVTPPADMKYAEIALGVNSDNTGSTDYAVARFDDVRFELATEDEFAIVPAHSGSWFDPSQSGHGITFEVLAGGRGQIYWYTYDLQGHPMWLIAVGQHDGVTFKADANVFAGAKFPPAFNGDDVIMERWGHFELHFNGCNSGVFKWTPETGSQFTAGQMPITRLTNLKGMTCEE